MTLSPNRICQSLLSQLPTPVKVAPLALLTLSLAQAQDVDVLKQAQHQKILGAEQCIECHESEIKAWHETKHYANKDLHKNDKAKEIARNMGITNPAQIQSSALCTQCHFTVQQVGSSPARVIDAVSCESCHGGARDWMDIHNQKDRREGADTAAQIAEAQSKGMLTPYQLHKVASNCFSCHIVTSEDLVNTGGHSPGSDEFDLVSWLKGEVRHNFFDSKGAKNAETAIERQRVQFVVGKALEMEYSMRGLARASGPGDYGNAMGRRCVGTRKEFDAIIGALGDSTPESLKEIQEKINVPGLLKFGNTEALLGAADAIQEKIGGFVDEHDGSKLSALDSLIPKEGKGEVFQP